MILVAIIVNPYKKLWSTSPGPCPKGWTCRAIVQRSKIDASPLVAEYAVEKWEEYNFIPFADLSKKN